MSYSETALTTTATLKDWLSIPASDTSADTVLGALIARASQFICRLVNRDVLFSKSITEKRRGNGQDRMFFSVRPVTAVTSLTIDGVTIPASTNNSAGYVFDDRKLMLIGYVFNPGYQNVWITYTGGIGQSDPEVAILEQACLELCAQKWKRRDHVDQVSQSMNGIQSVSFSTKDVPAEVMMALSNVRNAVPL